MKILETLEKNQFSYDEIKNKSFISLLNNEEFDINIIIGFRKRYDFINPIIESFKNAFKYYNKINPKYKFCLTMIEHSNAPSAKSIIGDKTNYLWTPGNVEPYSRGFVYNFGVKYSNKSKFYLLHDIDILVKENFFEELLQNLNDYKCLQPYGKRRVLYVSEQLTPKLINKEINYNTLNENSNGISLPMFAGKPALGSKGGSILIERKLFYEVGGFDAEIMWAYSAEDQFFWEKILTLENEIEYADKPPIDMFHMWHTPTSNTNPLLHQMEEYFLEFKNSGRSKRLNYINLQSKSINK